MVTSAIVLASLDEGEGRYVKAPAVPSPWQPRSSCYIRRLYMSSC
ncbi:unnamed protein product [Ectocarpus sp. 8 AP-2014]